MRQLQKAIAAIFAGYFCTLTFHQLPVLGDALMPRTKAITEALEIRKVGDTDTWEAAPTETVSTEEAEILYTVPTTETTQPEPQQTEAPPVATPPTATEVVTAVTTVEVTETTTTVTTTEVTEAVTEQVVTEASPTESELSTEAETIDTQSLFDTQETWFKAYMDYRTITDTDSMQYGLQQMAWTDSHGLRRIGDDYLVAMGTGWLTEGCGERFLVTLESGAQFTVMVGDVKADCHTDATNRYRSCGAGANVLEFIVDSQCMTSEARNAGTVSVYAELSGNLTNIARLAVSHR